MIKKNIYIFSVVFVLSLVCLSCNTLGSGGSIDINGMVYDFANKPVAYCEVLLGDSYAGGTDINGRFVLPKITPGTYNITVRKEGYETYSDEVLIKERGQIIYIRIPSQSQLLNLVDESLTAVNFNIAEEYIQRAYQIDQNNIETLFYYATIKFRQRKYNEALFFLLAAKNLGSRDSNIDRFIIILRELTDAHE